MTHAENALETGTTTYFYFCSGKIFLLSKSFLHPHLPIYITCSPSDKYSKMSSPSWDNEEYSWATQAEIDSFIKHLDKSKPILALCGAGLSAPPESPPTEGEAHIETVTKQLRFLALTRPRSIQDLCGSTSQTGGDWSWKQSRIEGILRLAIQRRSSLVLCASHRILTARRPIPRSSLETPCWIY